MAGTDVFRGEDLIRRLEEVGDQIENLRDATALGFADDVIDQLAELHGVMRLFAVRTSSAVAYNAGAMEAVLARLDTTENRVNRLLQLIESGHSS